MKKLTGNFFYIPCDTVFFNEFAKVFVMSAKEYAPEIDLHCHIFDATVDDTNWCKDNGISWTSEVTPAEYVTEDEKRAFWVNIRFCRITDIFDDSSAVMALDADSVVVDTITLSEFVDDTRVDWVTMRTKGVGALGGCVAFAPYYLGRYELKKRLEDDPQSFRWYLDQTVLNELVNENILTTFSNKYLDCTFKEHSKIWSGKGKTKYFNPNKKEGSKINKFANIIRSYKE